MSVIPLAELKDELNIPSSVTTDDVELQRKLDEAEAEYAECVGPLEDGTIRVSGGPTIILPRGVDEITEVAYTDGTAVDLDDLDPDYSSGLVYSSVLTRGTRNLDITYTVGALPANHKGAILADVAELWKRTQRRTTGGGLPNQQGVPDESPGLPLVRFPRIRALAGPLIA